MSRIARAMASSSSRWDFGSRETPVCSRIRPRGALSNCGRVRVGPHLIPLIHARVPMFRNRSLSAVMFIALGTATAACQNRDSVRAALIARAKKFELNTPYVPPPGDPAAHNASGFAKVMCSAVFITGLDPDFAAENVGYFTSPYADRKNAAKPVIDRSKKEVRVALPNG